jgi:hypothetical protein
MCACLFVNNRHGGVGCCGPNPTQTSATKCNAPLNDLVITPIDQIHSRIAIIYLSILFVDDMLAINSGIIIQVH